MPPSERAAHQAANARTPTPGLCLAAGRALTWAMMAFTSSLLALAPATARK